MKGLNGCKEGENQKNSEPQSFENDAAKSARANCSIAKSIGMPGHGIHKCNDPEPGRKPVNRIKHAAAKHKEKVSNIDERVEHVVSAEAEGKRCKKEKPSRRSNDDSDQDKWKALPDQWNSQDENTHDNRDRALEKGKQAIEENLADQKLSASHGIREELVEYPVVTVDKKAIRCIDCDSEACHRENT